jgi:hypothetical protein
MNTELVSLNNFCGHDVPGQCQLVHSIETTQRAVIYEKKLTCSFHQNLKRVIKIFTNEIGELRSTYLHSYRIRK